jgi:hypothetical protein
MGIELQPKRIDVCKLLINKGVKTETQGNTGGDPLPNEKRGAVDHPNKSVGGDKKVQEKRELIRVYSVKPKSMKKLCETLGVKPQPDEPANDKPSPQDVPTYDEPPIEAYAQYTLDDLEHFSGSHAPVWEPNEV